MQIEKKQVINFNGKYEETALSCCLSAFSRIIFASKQRRQTIITDLLETLAYLFFRFTIYGASYFRTEKKVELNDEKLNVCGPNFQVLVTNVMINMIFTVPKTSPE